MDEGDFDGHNLMLVVPMHRFALALSIVLSFSVAGDLRPQATRSCFETLISMRSLAAYKRLNAIWLKENNWGNLPKPIAIPLCNIFVAPRV